MLPMHLRPVQRQIVGMILLTAAILFFVVVRARGGWWRLW